MVYVLVVPVTGKLTVVLKPAVGEKLSPVDPVQFTGKEPVAEKEAVQPSQVWAGPLIFKEGLMATVCVLLPLQPGFSGFW